MTIELVDEVDPKKMGNTVIGERVHTLMWRHGRTQKQLAAVLNVDQGSVSNRLKGKTAWTVVDLLATAAWLDVPVTDLMPEVELLPPGDGDDGGAAGAPSRARTYDLRIISPEDLPSASVG
ncbi:helix-turn-helix domain-containing protein, partial [Mycolicibacterium fortuitum]|uniref:helix-turn-helix domain-containing protein n=1 Tax=Mycolicibacterium fortuitum TaxID=1766 RepID=UPI0010548429